MKEAEGGKKTRDIVFVTGNRNKVEELADHVKTKLVKMTILDLDLPEIQASDVLKIVQEKCKEAYRKVNEATVDGGETSPKRSVLIEDVCLNFKALNGMPGPYIKCESSWLKPH